MDEQAEAITNMLSRRLFVELEASGRHVHVTKEQAVALFGHDLTPRRPLSQPGQYLASERVTVKTDKGEIARVAVLGPARKKGQVEISYTDAVALGVTPPVRLSGELEGTLPVTLVGEKGSVTLPRGLMVARRHIHMTPADAALQHVSDGEVVRLKALTPRPVIFEDVVVRVSEQFATYAHLDYDEANACGFHRGDLGMILR